MRTFDLFMRLAAIRTFIRAWAFAGSFARFAASFAAASKGGKFVPVHVVQVDVLIEDLLEVSLSMQVLHTTQRMLHVA